MKWYIKILIALLVIVFSPIILFGLLIGFGVYLFNLPKNMKDYKNSQYYKDFQIPFKKYSFYLPQYRFYNSAKKRKLPIEYIRQESNGLEYFVYQDTLFLFPDFDQISLKEDESGWEVDYDGDWKDFEPSYQNIISKLENNRNMPVKLLVERNMFLRHKLTDVNIPECIFLTWSYEKVFENEDSPLKLIVPETTEELYDMMCQTPDICGTFEIKEKGKIYWDLYDDIQVEIGVDPRDCYIGVSKKLFGKIDSGITHWHPTIYDVYNDVCAIGKRGNILVIKNVPTSSTVLYMGEKDNCPYSVEYQKDKHNVYYLEAK